MTSTQSTNDPKADNDANEKLPLDPNLEGANIVQKKKHWFFNPLIFLVITLLTTIVKTSLGGYTSGVFSTIEKRFQLKSTETGAMSIVEDVIGLTTVMFIVHFGLKYHRPRVIFTLNCLIAVGAVCVSLPHFLFQLPPSIRSPVVKQSVNATGSNAAQNHLYCDVKLPIPNECTEEEKATSGALWNQAFFFPLGSVIQSLGSGVGPITLTYLDDNVPRRSLALYAGAIFSIFVFGSVFGYFLSSFCLQFPVTWPLYSTEYYNATPGDSNWLGAWWLGYILCSIAIVCLSTPLLFFPNYMRDPHEEETRQERYDREEAQRKKLEREESRASRTACRFSHVLDFLTDFFDTLKGVITNPVVMTLTLSGCMEAIGISGFFLFGPKMAQIVYELSPSRAAFVTGIFLIPGAMVGQFAGGYIVKRFNLTRLGMARVLAGSGFGLCFGCIGLFLIHCDKRQIAGVTVQYDYETYNTMKEFPAYESNFYLVANSRNITSICNKDCACPDKYNPVCGSDGINYVTACHAGCRDVFSNGTNTRYIDCSCISTQDNGKPGYASPGQCKTECNQYIYYLVICIPLSFVGTIAGICGFMLSLRSVKKNERGISMSFYNVLVKVLGYIPGPLIFGSVIELSCRLYQKTCGKTGNCNIYDSYGFRYGYVSVFGIAQILGFLFVLASYFFVSKQTKEENLAANDVDMKLAQDQEQKETDLAV